jgi:hypothetical protein
METRFSAVQQSLWCFLGGLGLVTVLVLPRPENRQVAAALTELDNLARPVLVPPARPAASPSSLARPWARFDDLAQLDSARRAESRGLASLSAAEIASAYKAQRGPKLSFAESPGAPGRGRGALKVEPLVALSLVTLADLVQHGSGEATARLGLPSAETLARSLALHLGRASVVNAPTAAPLAYSVTGIELLAIPGITAADARREQEVAELRLQQLAARAQLTSLERKLALAERRVELRKKRRSKSLTKFSEALVEVRHDHDEKARLYADLEQRYERAAAALDEPAWMGRPPEGELRRENGLPDWVVAEVRVLAEARPGAREPLKVEARPRTRERSVEFRGTNKGQVERTHELTLSFALPLEQRVVGLAPAPGLPTDLPAVRRAGLWDAVKTQDVAGARQTIERHFNWHRHSVSIAGLPIPGALVLQLLPALLPLLLLLVSRRIRAAATSHRLFSSKLPESLPRPGFKHRGAEFAALLVLPWLPLCCSALALESIGELPWGPALMTLATLPLGLRAYRGLEDLRSLGVSLVQYHSYPPPPLTARTTASSERAPLASA